jgi:hypothetical protein
MPRKKQRKVNTPPTQLAVVESSARGYFLNNRNVLSSVERNMRQDPRTRNLLDRNGGLNRMLTQEQNQGPERVYLPRFQSLQSALFIDRITEADISRTPSLQVMYGQSRSNNDVLTAIASELESCCEIIKNKLDNLQTDLEKDFRKLFNSLRTGF